MTRPSETVPRWALLALLIALAANGLAAAMTRVTIDLMRSHTPFAEAVRVHDLRLLVYYQPLAFVLAPAVLLAYLWPLFAHLRGESPPVAPPVVQRRAINAPAMIAGVGLVPWLLNALVYPLATVIHFGAWKPELASQQILSPVINGFLAATTTYLLLDWLFRIMVLPRVFPAGRLAEVAGFSADLRALDPVGVRGRSEPVAVVGIGGGGR